MAFYRDVSSNLPMLLASLYSNNFFRSLYIIRAACTSRHVNNSSNGKKGRLYQVLKMPASIMQIVKAIFFEAKVHASLYLYLYFYFLSLLAFFRIPRVDPIK